MVALPGKTWGEGPGDGGPAWSDLGRGTGGRWPCPVGLGARDPGDGGPAR